MLDQPRNYRILHLVSNMRWTGVAEPAASLAQWQMRGGHHVAFGAIWGRSLEEELLKRELPLARTLDLDRKMSPLATRRQIRDLRVYIMKQNFDVVHCHLLHDHWLASLAIRGIAADKRPRLVRTVHRYETMRRDPLHRWLFEKATNLVITVSAGQEQMIKKAYPALGNRLCVVHGGVDPEKFRPDLPGASLVRADMGEKPDNMVAGIVAHLGYNRGHKWLLQACPAALEKVANGVIWIVGHGELKRELRAEVRNPKYRGRVVMAGYRSDDLPETYAAMNAALLLGLGSEGSARAALEAMAAGCPVIGVKKGALLDTVADGYNGFLVEENDVDGLSTALANLLGNRGECARMGQNARSTVLERFTEEKRYIETMRSYDTAFEL